MKGNTAPDRITGRSNRDKGQGTRDRGQGTSGKSVNLKAET
jgi:hypothetical protein